MSLECLPSALNTNVKPQLVVNEWEAAVVAHLVGPAVGVVDHVRHTRELPSQEIFWVQRLSAAATPRANFTRRASLLLADAVSRVLLVLDAVLLVQLASAPSDRTRS
jgi:hypothetical protein